MRNPFTGVRSQLARLKWPARSIGAEGYDDLHDLGDGPRRIPLRLAAAAAAVVLLLVVLVVSSLDSSPGDQPTPAARQGAGADQPWWAGDVVPETASPSQTAQPASDTYLIVGPETQSPAASPSPTGTPGTPTTKRPPRATPAAFTAVAGDGCPGDATRGYQEIGRYTDGSRGWYSRSSGAWTGNGCAGSFDALPMSGSRDRDDTSAFVVWWFKPSTVRQGSCAISVYIPTGREFQDVAGAPAYYNVVSGQRNSSRVAGFRIDQIPARGTWVSAGTYPLRDGQITVQMVTRGQDPNGEHLAAAQVKASCRG